MNKPIYQFTMKNNKNYNLEERTAKFAENIIDLVKSIRTTPVNNCKNPKKMKIRKLENSLKIACLPAGRKTDPSADGLLN